MMQAIVFFLWCVYIILGCSKEETEYGPLGKVSDQ